MKLGAWSAPLRSTSRYSGRPRLLALRIFLQRSFCVRGGSFRGPDQRRPQAPHGSVGFERTAVHKNRSQKRLAGVCQNHFLFSAARAGLARGDNEMRSEFQPPGNLSAGPFANERVEVPRQFHLAGLWKAGK